MKAFHRDAIRNLAAVASTAPHELLSVPPGVTATMVRTSSALSRSLAMPFTRALVPAGPPSPEVRPYGFSNPPRGLLPGIGHNSAWSVSSCAVRWGNVVIFTRSQVPVNKGKGDINLALALARSGVLRVAQVIAP